MPKFGSLRGKMLVLILTPVAAAIILVTVLAISRASSDQKTAAFAELQQRTAVEALKVDATTGGALDVARSAAAVLGSSTSRSDTVGAYKTLLGANSKAIMAVFSSTLPNSFDGKDATSAARRAPTRTAASGRASR